jgi:hypothetical protein
MSTEVDDTRLYTENHESAFSGNNQDYNDMYTYLPSNFLGLDLKKLGSTTNNIFYVLKSRVDSIDTSFEDRTQGVRYLMRSPYIKAIHETTQSVIKIIDWDSYDVYSRYIFFSTNEKYLRLNDFIVQDIHPHWFSVASEKKHPLELTLLSCRYLLRTLNPGNALRHSILEFILDQIESTEISENLKGDSCDILITCGEGDEIDYGEACLKKLIKQQTSNPENLYNSQSVHNSSFVESAVKILRELRKSYTPDKTIDFLKEMIQVPQEHTEKVNKFFYRALTDTTKFDVYTILDCLYLVGKKIQEVTGDSYITCLNRLIEEILDAQDTCSTGYLVRIVNVLSGIIEGSEFSLKLDPRQELKQVINTRLSDILQSTPIAQRTTILDAIDKLSTDPEDEDSLYDIKQFVNYSMLYDDLQIDYINQGLLNDEDFNSVWNTCIFNYFGAKIY